MRKILKIVDLSTGFGDLTMPHRRTGNFFAGGGAGGAEEAVNHLRKKFSKVAKIFTK